jgi:hypothetical protein
MGKASTSQHQRQHHTSSKVKMIQNDGIMESSPAMSVQVVPTYSLSILFCDHANCSQKKSLLPDIPDITDPGV